MCDIEKMFHQFIVGENDRDFLRILWWKSGDLNAEPSEYRMRVHLFGAASSPGCANYGLKHLARNQKERFPKASAFVEKDFYVDDGLTSVESEQDAIQLIKDAQTLCAKGGLRLHKFISNSKDVITSIPASERASDVKDLDLALDLLPIEQALGIKWNVEADAFTFKVTSRDMSPTRRNILSVVASIFDPLGFLAPFTLKGKRILQEMCKSGIGWNDTLPPNRLHIWQDWINDLQNLELIKIPRCLIPSDFGTPQRIELHHFSDASTNAYGQCTYIRVVNDRGIHCALVIGKARVAPLKVVTIPRLELTAAVLSLKTSLFLRDELNISIDEEYFWTDSRVVLGYINNDARRFHVFVANRVQMIRDTTDPSQWYYVDSNSNPADHASRGLRTAELSSSSWLNGPKYLWQNHIDLTCVRPDLQLGDPEVRSVQCNRIATTYPSLLDYLERYSCWTLIISIVTRLQRLSNGIKGTYMPTVEERINGERAIVSLLQQDAFGDAIKLLRKETGAQLPRSHPLFSLDPIMLNGLLRVGSRLTKSDETTEFKHPVILPKESRFTRLILSHAHSEIQHQGRGMTLNKLRSMGYWIVCGSKTVAKFIRQCVTCRKLRRPTECQKMANLPKDRLEPSPPFTYCGMDCFGPFTVKQGRKEFKRYGLLFTCMCSRAIHIEMLDDMTTDAFINGLRCFIAIRGAVRQIRSDQGSNFVGAKNEFETNGAKIASFLAGKQCDFFMNAPHASHTGGVLERQIRTVRIILSAILQLSPGRLDDSSLRTVFYEVISIVNSRPLTVSEIDDPKTLEPLTPNHILTAKSSIPLPPPGEFVQEDLFLRKRNRFGRDGRRSTWLSYL